MPHILVDENVPKSVTDWLRKKGITTTNVSETDLKGAKDHTIAEYAAKNNLTISRWTWTLHKSTTHS